MAFFEFSNIKISGIAAAVPKIVVDVSRFSDIFGEKRTKKIIKSVGVKQYRKTSEHQTASDLCFVAAENLISKLEVNREEIGALIFVAHSTDYRRPATACVLHKRLKLGKECACFDVNLGCSAYVYGLNIAASIMQCSDISKVLLLVGETISKMTNPKDSATVMIFGDGGSATLVEKSEGSSVRGLLRSDGTGYRKIIAPAGGFRNLRAPNTPIEWEDGNIRTLYNTNMDGVGVFNFSMEEVPRAINDFIEYFRLTREEFDVFAFHQANYYLQKQIAKRLNVSLDKMPTCLDKYGNTSAAAIPLLLCNEYGNSNIDNSSIRVLACGFGVGLSWGVADFVVSDNCIFPVVETDDYFKEGVINGPEDLMENVKPEI